MICPATPADLPRLLAMVHALAAHHGDPAACPIEALERDLFGARGFLTVLIADGGYTALHPVAQLHWGVRGIEMHHLFVTPERRGTGLGRALVAAAVAHARAEGAVSLSLGTHPDNHAARAFYTTIGFAPRDPGPRLALRLD